MTSFAFYTILVIVAIIGQLFIDKLDRKKTLEKHNFKDEDTILNNFRYTILKQPEPSGTLHEKDVDNFHKDRTLQDIKELEDIIDFIKQNHALPKKYEYEVDDFLYKDHRKYQDFLFKKLQEIKWAIPLEKKHEDWEYDMLEDELYILAKSINGFK